MFELHFAPKAHALESLLMLHARFVTLGSLASLASFILLTNCSPSADDTGALPNGTGGSVAGAGGSSPAGGVGNAGGSLTGGGPGNPGGGSGAGDTGAGGVMNPNAGGSQSGGAGPGTGGGSQGDGGSGPDLDAEGKPNAGPGAMSSVPQDYLRIGEIRILNNNWGSAELGCSQQVSSMSIFIEQDKSFGWTFSRADCDTADARNKPDFPQIEFGVHPFGPGSNLATSPDHSSTTLLPKQIKDIQSASVNVKNLQAMMEQTESWNITFEFWLSERNPLEPNPGVYAELMTFWGWQPNRWPDSGEMPGPIGNGGGQEVSSGGKNYKLWVQDDGWAKQDKWPQGWRYFQFRDAGGSNNSFNGTLDVKAFLDYLVNTRGYSPDLWVTRLEVGSEIDDNTRGTVKMQGVTFEVNGQSRSEVIGN